MASHVQKALRNFVFLLFLLLLLCYFNYDTLDEFNPGHAMVGFGYDIKSFPGRNGGFKRSRYVATNNGAASLKLTRFVKLNQSSLFASSLILLAGDVCPQPGPASQPHLDFPTVTIKAKGFVIGYLNFCSLREKLDQLKLITNNTKTFDILTSPSAKLSKTFDNLAGREYSSSRGTYSTFSVFSTGSNGSNWWRCCSLLSGRSYVLNTWRPKQWKRNPLVTSKSSEM